MLTDTALFNQERAIALMRSYGLDAIIATTPENVLYASGLESLRPFVLRDPEYLVIWPAEGNDAALVIPKADMLYVSGQPLYVKAIVTYGPSTVMLPEDRDKLTSYESAAYDLLVAHKASSPSSVQALVQVLSERSLTNARLGLDEIGLSPRTAAAIRAALPHAQIEDAFQAWREIRAVKTPEEIRRLREAARVNEEALSRVYRSIVEGVQGQLLERVFATSLSDLGGNFAHWDAGIGTQSCGFFPLSTYQARLSDLVRVDAACTLQHYWADTGRTLVLGEANGKAQAYYAALRAGVEAGIEMVRPGVKPSEVFDRIIQTVKKEGIPQYRRLHCGHGLGLEFYEIPAIRPASEREATPSNDTGPCLEKGMVLNIEAPYYELGFGGLQLEETVLVTATGTECLTTCDRQMLICQ
jgi:Xaa-Pro dipeptidase